MAGCYGSDPEDRAREQELFRYLGEAKDDDEDEAAYWAEVESDRRREEKLIGDQHG
jgi:hypothetical protein